MKRAIGKRILCVGFVISQSSIESHDGRLVKVL